jgi:hypothetical protein
MAKRTHSKNGPARKTAVGLVSGRLASAKRVPLPKPPSPSEVRRIGKSILEDYSDAFRELEKK